MWQGILAAVITGLIWGVTDPLMKKFSAYPKNRENKVSKVLPFLANWQYALTFVTNQLGSISFLWTLNQTSLSFAVPVTNSLKFLITLITGQILGESRLNQRSVFGLVLMFSGVSLHIYETVQHGSSG